MIPGEPSSTLPAAALVNALIGLAAVGAGPANLVQTPLSALVDQVAGAVMPLISGVGGQIYPSPAAGVAATAEGAYFVAEDEAGAIVIYCRTSGTAVEKLRVPAADALTTLQASVASEFAARLVGGDLMQVSQPGAVVALLDRTGRVALEVRDDGSGYLAGRKLLTEWDDAATLQPTQRAYVAVYGGSHSINYSASGAPLDTPEPGYCLMLNTGPESFAGSSNGVVAPTGTVGWSGGITRERAIVPVMRAMAYGALAGTELVVDLPGRLGANGQLDLLTSGSVAFSNLVANVACAAAEATAEGRTFRVAAMFFTGGDQDWRDAYSEEGYGKAFLAFDRAEREALASHATGNPYPRFVRQLADHAYWSSSAQLNVVLAQGKLSAVKNVFVVGPSYQFDHVDGASAGWANAYLLTPHGQRHAGLMDAKAWARWSRTGAWRPCEMIAARLYGRRVIELLVHVPVPPLQFSTTTVAAAPDGLHGLEVWIGATRYAPGSVTIADDGATTRVGRVVIAMNAPLPAGVVEVWAGRSTAIVGTAAGDYVEGRQPGPLLGPRTTICDSDTVEGEPWVYAVAGLSGAYDLRNYLLVGRIFAQ